MKPPPRETVIKKVRRRRATGFRAYHLLALALLIPVFSLPSSESGHSDATFSQATQAWAQKSYGAEIAPDEKPDSEEFASYELVEGSAPATREPLHVPPIDVDLSPERFAQLNGAVPLDRALFPDPPRRIITIGTRRASPDRQIGRGSATAPAEGSTTATAFAPVPEPSVALTLAAGACLGLLRRRRRKR